MKKFIYIPVAALLALSACQKNISDLNTNPKTATKVPGETLFSNAQKNFADIMTTPNVNNNIFEFITQYWAATTYPQESRYDLGNRNIPQNWWTVLYRDVLRDLKESKTLIAQENAITPEQKAQKANKLAIITVEQVHAYSTLLNTFGNIPFSQALDVTKPTPSYDDQATVFSALLDSLDLAIGNMDVNGSSFDNADLLYHGDVNAWYKFANSLKLRLAMVIADADPAKSKTLVEQAAPNVFSSNADNANFQYLVTPPNTNPIWTNLVQSNRNDFVPANTLVNMMNNLNDPRRAAYFSKDPNGLYSGGIYGSGNTFSNFSHVSDMILAPDFRSVFMDYAEVEFLLAEAAERGMNVGGTAESHYNNAVTASIEEWGGSSADAMAYLAQPSVNYATASSNWKEKIGDQAWISMYLRGFDSWVEWRRLDFPALVKPASALSDIPVRYTYPSNEQNLNDANYQQASAAIGGDKVTTHLFWDKY